MTEPNVMPKQLNPISYACSGNPTIGQLIDYMKDNLGHKEAVRIARNIYHNNSGKQKTIKHRKYQIRGK